MYLYVMQCADNYKIGYSNNPSKRLRQLRTGSPYPVRLVYKLESSLFCQIIERRLHWKFRDKRVAGEWFKLEQPDLDYIMQIDEMGRDLAQQARHAERVAKWEAEHPVPHGLTRVEAAILNIERRFGQET